MILILTTAALASAQQTAAERIRTAMAASLAKQRGSISRQAASRQAAARQMPAHQVAVVSSPPLRAFVAASPVPVVSPPACAPMEAPLLTELIGNAAEAHDVPSKLIREVARQESAFRPCAVSRAGAEGVMQLMPATQATLRVTNPFDPAQSIDAGARLLKQLLERYGGDLSLALSAYNAGPARVDRLLTVPQIPETQNYVSTILDRLEQ